MKLHGVGSPADKALDKQKNATSKVRDEPPKKKVSL